MPRFKTEQEYANVLSLRSRFLPFGTGNGRGARQSRMGLFSRSDKYHTTVLARLHGGISAIRAMPVNSPQALQLWEDALTANDRAYNVFQQRWRLNDPQWRQLNEYGYYYYSTYKDTGTDWGWQWVDEEVYPRFDDEAEPAAYNYLLWREKQEKSIKEEQARQRELARLKEIQDRIDEPNRQRKDFIANESYLKNRQDLRFQRGSRQGTASGSAKGTLNTQAGASVVGVSFL